MGSIREFIDRQGFLVIDGGLATELERLGYSLDDPLWSAKILLSDPEKIAEVHESYFEAGADVGITSSYQATFAGLEASGLNTDEAERVIQRSVKVAVEARKRFWDEPANRTGRLFPLVAASIGPYGAFLHDGSEFRGNYGLSRQELKDFHRKRLNVLAASEADLLACETIPSLVEAEALADLLQEIGTTPAWVSFSCKDGSHISDGSLFSEAVALMSEAPCVAAIGLNCTAPGLVDPLLEKARSATDKPLLVYPNSGELFDGVTRSWRPTSEVGMIEQAACGWHKRGALLIGGCCRTTPDTVLGIRRALSGVALGRSDSK